jgi:restriction system protein
MKGFTMARRSSFSSLLTGIAREQARRVREQERFARQQQLNYERAQHHAARSKALADKEVKQRYLESRIEETENNNNQLAKKIEELSIILDHTLQVNDTIIFDDLRIKDHYPEFSIPSDFQNKPKAPKLESFLMEVEKPSGLKKLVPGAEGRYQIALSEMKRKYEEARKKYDALIEEYDSKYQKLRAEYELEKQAFDSKVIERNNEVDELAHAYLNGDPNALISYCTMVLERSEYPDGFPQEFRIAYLPEPKELVIEYELPGKDIVPIVSEYRYIKSKDTIEEKLRKAGDIKDQYQDIVASLCIRTIHEVLEADQGNNILVVAFNGFVQGVDPSTGRDIRPCLISIRTTKERFREINLNRIDKRACLRNLGAQVSSRPDEMQSIKPIVEFDMVDKRFVEQSDVLSDLESRPNLMDLDPFEFENLVSNLFEQMGFQTKQTRSSKDGGVDAIAFDPRPILGGKVVIQAKRYKNVVGVW